ncbi:hypothetical protein BJ165DRAFT_1321117, partial [Panaeolus papilionaceus]
EAVDWIRQDGRILALAARLGATVKDRGYQVMVKYIPLTYDDNIANGTAPREIEECNNIEEGAIKEARWIKPIERRREEQACAHAMLTFSNPKDANIAIRDGMVVHDTHCCPERSSKDALRCLNCQEFDHIAANCPNKTICGTCGENHRTKGCTKTSSPWCVSCQNRKHSSWSRKCPVFISKTAELQKKFPENDLKYFPTEEPWTW